MPRESTLVRTTDAIAAATGPFTVPSAIVLGGLLGRLALGFAASILLARGLGPEGYGTLAVVAAVLALVQTVADTGLRYGALHTIARVREAEPHRVSDYSAAYLCLLVVANGVAAALVIPALGWIADVALGRPELAGTLRLAMLGLIPSAIGVACSVLLQADRQFGTLVISQLSTAATNVVGVVLLAVLGHLTVTAVVLLGALNPLVAVVFAWPRVPRGWMTWGAVRLAALERGWRELVPFSKWMWISAMLSLVASQLDLLLVTRWMSPAAAGVYALAFNLALRIDVLNQARMTVRLPTVSAFRRGEEAWSYARTSARRGLVLAAGIGIPAVVFARPFIHGIYGVAFADAATIFVVLLLAVLFDLVTTPLLLLAFPLNAPRAMAGSDAIRVTMLALGMLVLVPQLGLVGAALAKLCSRVAGAVMLWLVLRRSTFES
jgi:O-antigen/teichoic acid export membrane protein